MREDLLSLSPYLLLLAAILSLWLKRDIKIWGAFSILAVVSGIIAGRLELIGAVSIAATAVCYYSALKVSGERSRLPAEAAAAVLAVALGAHLLPGFNNWKIVDQMRFSEASAPYSMWLNLDKPFVGLFILGFGFPLAGGPDEWRRMIRGAAPVFAAGLIILVVCGRLMGEIRFDLKWSGLIGVWAVRNLFFTCVAEEAFFRGFLQKRLSDVLGRFQWGKPASVGTAGLLFGAAHFAGGAKYVVLASVAGVMYGWAYNKTQKIEAAIVCHFGVNLFRFVFLTYPAVAG